MQILIYLSIIIDWLVVDCLLYFLHRHVMEERLRNDLQWPCTLNFVYLSLPLSLSPSLSLSLSLSLSSTYHCCRRRRSTFRPPFLATRRTVGFRGLRTIDPRGNLELTRRLNASTTRFKFGHPATSKLRFGHLGHPFADPSPPSCSSCCGLQNPITCSYIYHSWVVGPPRATAIHRRPTVKT